MAHCDEYLELISAAVDGALSPVEQEKLNAHLASCAECQKLYADLSALHAALTDFPPVEVPEGLKDRIMAAVAAETENAKILPFAPKKASRHWQRWLASAAVLAVVVMGTWSWKPWEVHEPQANFPRSNEVTSDLGMDSASFTVIGTAGAADGAAPAAPAPQPSSLSVPADAPAETARAAMPKLASAPLDAAPTADFTTESTEAPAEKNAVRSGKEAPSLSPNVGVAAQGVGTAVPAENGAAPDHDETVYGYAPVGQAPDVSVPEDVPAVQSTPAGESSSLQAPAEAPAPQSAVMPRLFSAPLPQSIPSPAAENAPEQGQSVTSQAEAVNVLANYIYEFVGDVAPLEDSPDGSYAVNSPTGVSGVVTCVGENEEVYFLNYKDDLSPDPLLYSVNKLTSEVALLEQESATAGISIISRIDAVNALVSRFYDGQVEHIEVTEEEPGVRYTVGISPDAYWLGGASGVIVYVGEDEEVYLFDAKNDFSNQWIHLSVNKRTSEIIELEEEEQPSAPASN